MYRGVEYFSKGKEFTRLLELPSRSSGRFKVALGGKNAPCEELRRYGWEVVDGPTMTLSSENYRSFIADSCGEISPRQAGLRSHAHGMVQLPHRVLSGCGPACDRSRYRAIEVSTEWRRPVRIQFSGRCHRERGGGRGSAGISPCARTRTGHRIPRLGQSVDSVHRGYNEYWLDGCRRPTTTSTLTSKFDSPRGGVHFVPAQPARTAST